MAAPGNAFTDKVVLITGGTEGIGLAAASVRLVAFALAQLGRLDTAVNNAAADNRIAPAAEVTDAAFDTRVAVNLKGAWLCMKYETAAAIALLCSAASSYVVGDALVIDGGLTA